MRTCFRHAGNAGSLRGDLANAHDHRLPDQAAELLLARPGRAYRVDGEPGHPEPGHLVVLSFDDGWCGIGGTGIDPHALTLRLVDAMRAVGTTMRMMGVAEDGREQRYLLVRPAPAHPLVLLVLLQSAGHLQQASLFAAPLPPPEATR